jgi:hypothetical protein
MVIGKYTIELCRRGGFAAGVEEIIASDDILTTARALYREAVANNPGRVVLLCDRARVLARSDRPETMPRRLARSSASTAAFRLSATYPARLRSARGGNHRPRQRARPVGTGDGTKSYARTIGTDCPDKMAFESSPTALSKQKAPARMLGLAGAKF